ncbi:secreted protein containing Lytic transglycosylase-like, catalytic domain protein [Candidatus Magnetomorum sp. HK-1]|nr:secreted protein containing Lytic transglycosylase-like, catalytic domain protein [Candidatus Magnetomorum sp. HK-1]
MRLTGRKKMNALFFFCVLFFCSVMQISTSLASQDKYFPIPPFLCDNVLFWKKVYTNVSVDEGLIHDREYPLIIYQKIHVGSRRGRTLDQYVESYKKRIANLLREIPNLPAAGRTEEQKRIVRMFQEYSSLNDIPKAIGRIRFQLGQRESFLKGLEQSGMYIDEIFSIIRRENLPLRLAYLPHVESAFNTHAVSKAGAVGLWQFMWETGKQFLDIDRYIDERRDPILSTEAAITLLKKNYNELKSWPLAITAYNYGLAGIKRAVRSTKSTDISLIIQKHKSRSFQFASKNFYSCFLAACEIDENYQRYFKLVNMDSPLLRKRFILATPIRPDELCNHLNISLFEFKALNPAFKPSLYKYEAVIPKQYTVFLPLTVDLDNSDNLLEIPKKQVQNPLKYEHQSPEKIKTNFLTKQKFHKNKDKIAIKKTQSTKSSIKKSVPIKKKYHQYIVKKGDSIWLIARKFKTDGHTLRKINGLSRLSYIYPGQQLRVPEILYKKSIKKNSKKQKQKAKTNDSKKIFSESMVSSQQSPKEIVESDNIEKTFWKKYRVKDGDSLWDIAQMMNLSPEKIKKINQLKTQRLQPGQILFIPQKLEVPNPPKIKTDNQKLAIERIHKLREQQKKMLMIDYYHTVQPGENLKSISQKTGVSIEDIVIINHMSEDLRVYEGQVLRIPKKQTHQ